MCIFVSAVLDALDGKVARLLGQSSRFGAELDSLSDLVCFGVAPSIILFLRSAQAYGRIGWGACMFFTICCALRLARFNTLQAMVDQKPEWTKKYFSGVPAPAGAVLVMFPMILFFETGNCSFLSPQLVTFCLLTSGALMISTLKTFSSKMLESLNCSAFFLLLSISFLVICLVSEPWLTLSILIISYVVSIPYGVRRYSRCLEMDEAMKEERKAS
jgi:CDP-diacylglycerol--serine O-phosphatidyltransferase